MDQHQTFIARLKIINQEGNFLAFEDRHDFFQLVFLQEEIQLTAAAFLQGDFQLHRQRFIGQRNLADHCVRNLAQRIKAVDFRNLAAGEHGV